MSHSPWETMAIRQSDQTIHRDKDNTYELFWMRKKAVILPSGKTESKKKFAMILKKLFFAFTGQGYSASKRRAPGLICGALTS